jgi:uncharacterized protein (DUF362 family)
VFDLPALRDKLAAQAHPEGGWGYAPGLEAHLEPTCLALLALAPERDRLRPAFDAGLAWLDRNSPGDGTYRLARGREAAVWPTALALFAKASLGRPADELRPSVAALLGLKGKAQQHNKEAAEVQDIDLGLVGWPWAEGNFSWAEPTAWAVLALRHAGHGSHPRVEEGVRLLLDRALDEGGINYGNRRVLGRLTEPIPGPTALMLLALQGHADHPRLDAAIDYLLRQALVNEDLEHLCWARLALDCYRDRPAIAEQLGVIEKRIRAAYEERANTPWLRPNPLREALTILALAAGQHNPARLNGTPAGVAPVEPRTPTSRKAPLMERLQGTFRNLMITGLGNLRQPPTRSSVHVARADSYDDDLLAVLQKQYEHFRAQTPLAGKRVVLKPNLVEYHRDKVINTNPKVVAAVIELCKREGAAEIIVAEGPGHWRNVEYLVSASGLGDVLRQHGVRFVDVNHDEPVKTPNLGRLTGLDHLFLSRTVATADVLISLPKLKTHHWAVATLSLKNLFGTLPGICYGWPKNELHWRGIDNSIVDIALTRGPDLAIVDGIVGMEGDGPLNGTARKMGVLVMGADPLAVDATCCRLMQLDPERVAHLGLAALKKLGRIKEQDIDQVGEALAGLAQPFETVPHFAKLRLGVGVPA